MSSDRLEPTRTGESMTLDEAIAHAEQMVVLAKRWPLEDECKQYAEWLRELKRLRVENDMLRAENAKFRALCIDMWHAIPQSESCGWDSDANCCSGYETCNCECAYWYRMHELGIEHSDLGGRGMMLSENLRQWKANLSPRTSVEYVLTLRADVNCFADAAEALEWENAKLCELIRLMAERDSLLLCGHGCNPHACKAYGSDICGSIACLSDELGIEVDDE